MSTSIVKKGQDALDGAKKIITRQRSIVDPEQEKMYARFFAAAVFGLVLGGIQGIIQRLPGVSDWLYKAGYGGHLITNLAQTHIIMVGAGTLTLTAVMYYILPRILNRPLYSTNMTKMAFWFTFIGVYSFYFVMIIEGLLLGSAVTRGISYDDARRALGAWYDAPTGIAGGLMGVGYWIYVANIYLTMRGPKSWKGPEAFIAKYIFLGTTGLFIGTLQGFYQILPWSVNFIRDTGEAGREIDPVAHAHINMVGGVAIALMGMSYYILPRILGKPIWNMKLVRISFWFTVIGVYCFWLTLIILGIVEGNIMIDLMRHANNLTQDQAYDMAVNQVGIWHPLLRAGFGTCMGIGFWAYITIIIKTFLGREKASAFPKALVAGDTAVPAPSADSRFNAVFFFASVIAMLIGTIQGVIQILPFASNWLLEAGQAGDLVTPLAHAQMNIIASLGLGLMGLVYFALPRFTGKQWASQPLIRISFICMVVGTVIFYVALLILGMIESVRVHELISGAHPLDQIAAFQQARNEVGWAHPFWLVFGNCFLAVGYITYALNVWATLGPEHVRSTIADAVLQVAGTFDRELAVDKRQLVKSRDVLRWRTIRTFLVEVAAGSIGFVGSGWITSGRSSFGFKLLFFWMGGWIIAIEWVLATQSQLNGPDLSFVRPLFPLYFALVLFSACCAALTYSRRGLKKKGRPAVQTRVVESSALLIDDAKTIEVID